MTVVVGTAGHIDHGKTALLRALTGIDADRLPEERRRGMTIDVGYAHFGLPDGSEIDFVDVPGHDGLVGNMLVGAGEIDAAMLVVAADDGPRAQTIEHLGLIDALGIEHGLAVITKTDAVPATRVDEIREAVKQLLAETTLAGSPVLAASSVTGAGIDAVRQALVELRDRVAARPSGIVGPGRPGASRLAIDRVFSIKGRGLVVTGTLRGGPLVRNASLRLVPGKTTVRARELQLHSKPVEVAGPGRTAINLAGIDAADVHRGTVLTDDDGVSATDRILVRLRRPLADRTHVRAHLGTAAVDATIVRSGRDAIDLEGGAAAAILRLSTPLAVAAGDRLVLRLGTGSDRAIGGIVLDVGPARGISRRRQTPERVLRLAAAVEARDAVAIETARLDLHGAVATKGFTALAEDVAETAADDVVAALGAWGAAPDARPGLAEVRVRCARGLRRLTSLRRDEAARAASTLIDTLVSQGRLVRDGDAIALPGEHRPNPLDADPGLVSAVDRLLGALAVTSPPPLSDAARVAGVPAVGIRELQRTGRIVLLDDDLAYEAATYQGLEAQALDLARRAPLTPATLRDATATSRKYVMAILADLDRREILRRTGAGHVPGPRAGSVTPRGDAVAGGRRLAEP
jgi:selenocysteine-specific elongation factor